MVIISNQSGIQRGKMTVDDWRTKATRIKEKLGIPLQVVALNTDPMYTWVNIKYLNCSLIAPKASAEGACI